MASGRARQALEAIRRCRSGVTSNNQGWLQEAQAHDLARAWGVLSVCRVRVFVRAAPTLLALGKKFFGSGPIRRIVKPTFFEQFCGGEREADLKPLLQKLYKRGVGGILDYAAEMDIAQGKPGRAEKETVYNNESVARIYDYESEEACEANKETFLKAVQTVCNTTPRGFAAIKVTALGNPLLVERAASALTEVKNLFTTFDVNSTGSISMGEFRSIYQSLFRDGTDSRIKQVFHHIDENNDGRIDYLEWANKVKLEDMQLIASRCRDSKDRTFTEAALQEDEVVLFQAMQRRLREVATLANTLGVRLMIDAEHTYFQPAIDHLVLQLQREFNKERPIIFNTYQTYLKDSSERMGNDMHRSRREGFRFAAKLVRGAYMVLERDRAKRKGYSSPIHDSFEATEANFHRAISVLVQEVKLKKAAVMIATHNYNSIEHSLEEMDSLGILKMGEDLSGVSFGQLLGMSDKLTYTLGENGIDSFKYVPYGPLEEVLPYLVRRAQENSELMSNSKKDIAMIGSELVRRLKRKLKLMA